MADKETEEEWARLRRVEAEREKARRALEEQKPDAVGLACLGPQKKKIRGWSVDRNLLLTKTEKLGTWSVIFAPVGVVLLIISDAGSIVSEAGNFGLGGLVISGIPGGIGAGCLGIAAFLAVLVIGVELYCKFRDKRMFGTGWWSAVVGFIIVVVYVMAKMMIMRFV